MKTISVVINARLGSSRVPQKLTRAFAGTTLLQIALEKLNRMDFFDKRYLAIAEDQLKQLATPYENVEILSRDVSAVKPGVNPPGITFAHYKNVPTDYVFVFNPCLPFVSVDTIKTAYDYFQKTDYRSYTSVVKTGDWVFDDEGNALTNTDPRNLTTNKGREYFKAAHAFHIITRSYFAETDLHWTFAPDDPHLIRTNEEEMVDIDTELEFAFAEFLYNQGNREKKVGSI